MSDAPRDPERARLDRLMTVMLGGLLCLGAGILLVLAVLTALLPHATLNGTAVLLLPGTAGRHGLSPLVVPVLGSSAAVLGLGGLATLVLGRRRAPFAAVPRVAPRAPSFRRPVLVLLAGTALLAVVLLRR